MSRREIRLCDKPECNLEFVAVCLFCEIECCKTHLGEGFVRLNFELLVSNMSNPDHLGRILFRACGDCIGALNRGQRVHVKSRGPGEAPYAAFEPAAFETALAEAIRARLAADALAAKEEP